MGKKSKGPVMIPIELYRMAGIDIKTGTPSRASSSETPKRQQIRNALRVMDEQDAINRYRWYNLPILDMTGQFLERMLYFHYTLCLFKYNGKFYITPFAYEGSIDFYGRFNYIHPVPLSYGKDGEITDAKEIKKAQESDPLYAVLSSLKLRVVKEISDQPLGDEPVAVIIQDYSPQRNPNNATPRQQLNEPLLTMETDIIQYMRTAMITSSGVKGIRVHDADESVSVLAAAKSMEDSARNGLPFVPMITKLDAQDLGTRSTTSFQDYLLSLQSVDNFRMSLLGIDNGGIFQKKEHKLEAEQNMNSSPVGLINMDGLSLRQMFCNIANSVWGGSMWCEPNDAISQGEVDYEEPEEENEGGEEDVLQS